MENISNMSREDQLKYGNGILVRENGVCKCSSGDLMEELGQGKIAQDLGSSTISNKNKLTVRVHDIGKPDFELIAEISPPFFSYITLVKLSPSGRLLLVGNEYSQFFHVYQLFPQTGRRFNEKSCFCKHLQARLRFILMRGKFSSAKITDC